VHWRCVAARRQPTGQDPRRHDLQRQHLSSVRQRSPVLRARAEDSAGRPRMGSGELGPHLRRDCPTSALGLPHICAGTAAHLRQYSHICVRMTPTDGREGVADVGGVRAEFVAAGGDGGGTDRAAYVAGIPPALVRAHGVLRSAMAAGQAHQQTNKHANSATGCGQRQQRKQLWPSVCRSRASPRGSE
jgi:hypothetical protein